MVRPEGFEPPTNRFEADYSIQLSYGRKLLPKSSDLKSNDTRKCPVGHPGHFLVTPESPRFTPVRKSLIVLPISTIRTSDLDVRSAVLYPAELRAPARSLALMEPIGNLATAFSWEIGNLLCSYRNPPPARMISPVTQAELSEARNTATEAMSLG
jgi:hypothetical protein